MMAKILIVDDELDILKMVVFRLRKSGYEVITATDGQEALEMIEKDNPDLIILDLVLPKIDGYEVCKRLKASDEFRNMPVIFLTASTCADLSEKAKELGADDYLTKPFEPDILIERVGKYVAH